MDQFSPKSSPLGSRSPNVGPAVPGAVESSGLKMTISLKQKVPFYLVRQEPIPTSDLTGATNLMAARGLEHSYQKLTTKKMKDTLSSFLVNLPGMIDTPGSQDNSSLRGLIDKPPVCGKELVPLNQLQLAGFRLHPGPLPDQYRAMLQTTSRKRHKQKKHKLKTVEPGLPAEETKEEERDKKRDKKHKKHERDKDSEERKKKKKEKKKKRNKEDKEL